jgi:imidazole glycerol-phosphate synthase subunit HisF
MDSPYCQILLKGFDVTMVKKRLIVSLLYADGFIVQSCNFKHTNVVGSMQIAIEFFNVWEADEIIILNVSRNKSTFDTFVEHVGDVSKTSFLPLSIGGWIDSLEKAEKLFNSGADKIVINTAIFNNPSLIKNITNSFGVQSVVASIDVRMIDGSYLVFVDRGTKNTKIKILDWVNTVENLGVGEIYLTSIDCDGMKKGYDLELMKIVADNADVPVIAFGGVQNFHDMVLCLKNTKVEAVSAGNPFHYTEQSTRVCKNILIESGIDVRVPNNYYNY